MGLLSSLLGNASEVSADKVEKQIEGILVDDERVERAFAVFRDLFLFTNRRLILIDRQGVTGSKQEFLSIPYGKITKFSIENAGTFDADGELKLWIGSDPQPLQKQVSRRIDIRGLYRTLSHYVLE